MVTIKTKGNFKNTESFLSRALSFKDNYAKLQAYAQKGVEALSKATPVDTGKTANSWGYEISYLNGDIRINWTNSNANNGVNIAVILQYGHGTGNGGYVEGIDYINPAMRPVFREIADSAWKDITK